jgi:hypothetical protein
MEAMKRTPISKEAGGGALLVRIKKSQGRYRRIRDPHGPDEGVGEFFLIVEIVAAGETVYVPVSIASGKKPTGFVYQIEGTAQGSIEETDISCGGEGVTQITSGTIRYAKIPKGKTAAFRILITMRGKVGKEYSIIIDRINYKFDPADARYERYEEEVRSKSLKFR